MIRCLSRLLALLGLLSTMPVVQGAQDVDALLKEVQKQQGVSAQINKDREARFLNDRNERVRVLNEALAEQRRLEAQVASRRAQFDAESRAMQQMQDELRNRAGDLNQLTSVVRQAATDLTAYDQEMLLAAQLPARAPVLQKLAESKALPNIRELERLWFLLQQAMTESGKTLRFNAPVMSVEGEVKVQPVTRVGPFAAVTEDTYLQYLPASGRFQVLGRQPEGGDAEALSEATSGPVTVLLDPTRGNAMSLLSLRPDLFERVHQGGVIGYLVILLGVIGFSCAGWQFTYLHRVAGAVKRQLMQLATPRDDNPLGRVLLLYRHEQAVDIESLELKLNEAILRETPPLERFQSLLRMIVAAGPLMGLLGTVIGMIITFQVIMEQGAGDPKLMAEGISIAMVATVLGLLVSIPLLFVNTLLASRSRVLVQILDEQSAGLLAARIEAAPRHV